MIEAKFNKTAIFRRVFFDLLFILLGFFILFRQLFQEYLSIDIFTISLFLLSVGFIDIKSLVKLSNVFLGSEFLTIKDIIGRIILKVKVSEVRNYSLIENKKNRRIILRLNNKEIQFVSSEIINFTELLNEFSIRFKRDISSEKEIKRKDLRKAGTLFLLLSIILLVALNITHWTRQILLESDDYKQLSGEILKEPFIVTSYGDTKVYFTLKGCPEFKFWFRGEFDKFRDEIGIGDSVYIKISGDDYRKKVSKSEELNFFDKYFKYQYIRIAEIESSNQIYLSLERFKMNLSENTSDIKYWIFQGVSIFFLLGGLIMIIINKGQLLTSGHKTLRG